MSQTKAQLLGGVGFSTADSLTVHNGLAVTGVVTATSFSGNGSGLVGLANTAFINAEQLTVVGVVTASSGAFSGNISAASGTFTGNVTVGGTLTYDDVTNVDSIGLVTARSGIQFGLAGVGGSVSGTGNANFSGIVTATSFSGDGSNLTGVDSNSINIVATGTLPDGKAVIVRTDGTVEAVSGTTYTQAAGSSVIFEGSGASSNIAATYDSTNNKVIVLYKPDGITYLEAIVGSISDTTISFGSQQQVDNSDANSGFLQIAYDSSSGKVIFGWQDRVSHQNRGVCAVGTISGTSISMGSKAVFDSVDADSISVSNIGDNQFLVAWQRGNQGRAKIGTISGTTITYGSTEYAFNGGSGLVDANFGVYDPSRGKTLLIFRDRIASNYLRGTVVTPSGTGSSATLSFGSEIFLSGTNAINAQVTGAYDSDTNKIIITYTNASTGYLKAIVGNINGTGFDFGDILTVNDANTTRGWPSYNAVAQKLVIAYSASSQLYVRECTVNASDNTLTIGDQSTSLGQVYGMFPPTSVYDSNAKRTFLAYSTGGTTVGRAIVWRTAYADSNLTTGNFAGFSDGAYSNGQTAKIRFGGVEDAQVGLSTGSFYYVQTNGTLATTADSFISVDGGLAISSTQLLIRR